MFVPRQRWMKVLMVDLTVITLFSSQTNDILPHVTMNISCSGQLLLVPLLHPFITSILYKNTNKDQGVFTRHDFKQGLNTYCTCFENKVMCPFVICDSSHQIFI